VTPLSRRYIPHLALLSLPVLLPVLVYSYGRVQLSSNQDPPPPCQSFPRPTEGLRARQMLEMFQGEQWCEGNIEGGLSFSVIRSYDPKKLYHHPEVALMRNAAPNRRTVEWVSDGSGMLPIHRAFYDTGDEGILVAYLLVYHARPVDNPYLAQLESFPIELLKGRSPMTLFFISAQGQHDRLADLESRSKKWLVDAWRGYRGQQE
jgi:hypothetical protein